MPKHIDVSNPVIEYIVMKNYKASRYLIDAVDRRLGSVEKELKFDKLMVILGVLLAAGAAAFMPMAAEKAPKFSVLLLIVAMFGIVLIITMAKEYINDLRRSKTENNQ